MPLHLPELLARPLADELFHRRVGVGKQARLLLGRQRVEPGDNLPGGRQMLKQIAHDHFHHLVERHADRLALERPADKRQRRHPARQCDRPVLAGLDLELPSWCAVPALIVEWLHQTGEPAQAAIEDPACAWPVRVHRAAVLAEMHASAVLAFLEKIAFVVVLDREVRQILGALLIGIEVDTRVPAALAAAVARYFGGIGHLASPCPGAAPQPSEIAARTGPGLPYRKLLPGVHAERPLSLLLLLLRLPSPLGLAHRSLRPSMSAGAPRRRGRRAAALAGRRLPVAAQRSATSRHWRRGCAPRCSRNPRSGDRWRGGSYARAANSQGRAGASRPPCGSPPAAWSPRAVPWRRRHRQARRSPARYGR